jgi:hypothetical protein
LCVRIRNRKSIIGPKPGRTLQYSMAKNQGSHPARRRARKPSIFPRPPVSLSSAAAEAAPSEQTPDVRSAVSHERPPIQDQTLLIRLNGLTLVSSSIPPPCGMAMAPPQLPEGRLAARRPQEGLHVTTRDEIASSPLGPCFCSDFAPLDSLRTPEEALSSTRLASVFAPQGVQYP